MEEKDKFKIRPFDGRENDDFQFWTLRVESFLKSCRLADLIHPDAAHLSLGDEGYERYLLNGKKAKAIMVRGTWGSRSALCADCARSVRNVNQGATAICRSNQLQ